MRTRSLARGALLGLIVLGLACTSRPIPTDLPAPAEFAPLVPSARRSLVAGLGLAGARYVGVERLGRTGSVILYFDLYPAGPVAAEPRGGYAVHEGPIDPAMPMDALPWSGGFMMGDESSDPELAELRRLNAVCNGAAP